MRESAHILLRRFLTDRTSEDPLAEKELFASDGIVEWGHAKPLEKVINSREDVEFLGLSRKVANLAIACQC